MTTVQFELVLLAAGLSLTAGEDQFLSAGDMDAYMPDFFWTLDAAHNGASSNPHTLYAILHNADLDLTNGPVYASSSVAGSLRFYGNASSYVEISNADGELDATDSFTWAMVLKADSEQTSGVILEYWDGVGGIRIEQNEKDLLITAHDASGNVHSLEETDVFRDLNWMFVCLSYINFDPWLPKEKPGKVLRLYVSDYTTAKPSPVKDLEVAEGTVLRGTGNVRLGASQDSAMPGFSGQLACLRYHNKYILRFSKDADYPLSCDPSGVFETSLDTLSEHTIDSSVVISTMAPVTQSTKETPQDVTTAAAAFGPGTAAALPTVATVTGSEMLDVCIRLTKQPGNAVFSPSTIILLEKNVDSFGECATACYSVPGCEAVAMETNVKDSSTVGICRLAGAGFQVVADPGYYVYRLTP